ncbi:MAG: glutathione S-transferase N-terminal domain-containing protein [Pseudomonadota bacterium]
MSGQPPIELHYWPTPNGFKVSIALEEMGLPYTTRFVNIMAGDQFQPEFLKISPNNRMPAIIDPSGPDGGPISVFESGAILQYLGRKTGMFYPENERARVAIDEWLMWQMGGFGPMLGQNHHFTRYAPETLPYAVDRYKRETERLYGVLDKRLDGRAFVAGDYSIADMAIIGWAVAHEWHHIDLADYPNVKRWHDALRERPAVQAGLALGKDEREKAKAMQEDPAVRERLFGVKSAS